LFNYEHIGDISLTSRKEHTNSKYTPKIINILDEIRYKTINTKTPTRNALSIIPQRRYVIYRSVWWFVYPFECV